MSIKMRPITKEDISNITSYSVYNIAPYDVSSQVEGSITDANIFEKKYDHRTDETYEYEDEFVRTAKISFPIPIISPFVAGDSGETFSTILGSEAKVEDIMYGKVVIDATTGAYWDSADLSSETDLGRFLVGGDAIKYLLENFDVEKAIYEEVYETFIFPFLEKEERKLWKENRKMVGEVVYNGEDFDPEMAGNWIFDNFLYMRFDDNGDFMEDEVFRICEESRSVVLTKIYKTNSRLIFLMAYLRNSEQIDTMITDEILVLPYGQRLSVDGRVDHLTRLYNTLVGISQDLRENIINKASINIIAHKYEMLVRYVVLIILGKNDKNIFVPDTYKSIKDRLTGKEGLIRDKMQGVRMDYCGRTVIACDPFLSVDTIKIPKRVLGKLMELDLIRDLRDSDPKLENQNLYKYALSPNQDFMNRRGIKYTKDGDQVVAIGRQPTLFRHGIQGFKVIPTDGNAIIISPLVVMPFNADFDGDQMHYKFPVTREGYNELKKLMSSTENLRYDRNGEITITPRHEIQYGLWICSKIKTGENQRTWSEAELIELAEQMGLKQNDAHAITVYEGVCNQLINVYDIINASTAYGKIDTHSMWGKTAGVWAIKFAMGKDNSKYVLGHTPLVQYGDTYFAITDENGKQKHVPAGTEGAVEYKYDDTVCVTKWFKAIINQTPTNRKKVFINMVNKMVRLGFKVAKIYPPSISIVNNIDFTKEINEFNAKIMERERWINLGFELESSYSEYFGREFKKLDKTIKDRIVEELGEENGYVRMTVSDSKGNKSNLGQIFGIKGRIMKNENEAFNTIISRSLSSQLNSLDHFITAYGSREGLADKVLATAEPGYLTRKLEHASATLQITVDDCGTENGITLRYDDIIPFVDETKLADNIEMDCSHVEEIILPILIGRVILPTNEYCYTMRQAKEIFDTYVVIKDANGEYRKGPGVTFRSPITCECPICKKCYGKDLVNGEDFSIKGRPVGIIAGQAIGEPGTQLTMKNFQRGGVASEANLTSAFDKIDAYFRVPKNSKSSRTMTYDHLSAVEGFVRPVYLGDGFKIIRVHPPIEDEYGNIVPDMRVNILRGKFIVPEGVILKDYVKVGDSFQKVQGDLDTREVLKYRGFDEAVKYLCLQMYRTFNEETEISLKHFETIVSSMISYIVCKGDDEINSGELLSTIEYHNWKPTKQVYCEKVILGLSELPAYRRDCFESLIMENQGSHIRRAIVVHPEDELKNPKTRVSFGLGLGMGTDVEGFLQ